MHFHRSSNTTAAFPPEPADDSSASAPDPFGPIDFSDPHWSDRVPEADLPKPKKGRIWNPTKRRRIAATQEAHVVAVLVLAKARRILWEQHPEAGDRNGTLSAQKMSPPDVHAHRTQPPARRGDDDASSPSTQSNKKTPAGLADWVEFRFCNPLIDSARAATRQTALVLWLSSATALLGVAASTFAVLGGDNKSSGLSVWTFIAAGCGVAVAGLTAITQIRRPGQRSVALYQHMHTLRREGWAFVSGRGSYGRGGSRALDLFIEAVNRIQRGVESIDETAGDTASAASPSVAPGA